MLILNSTTITNTPYIMRNRDRGGLRGKKKTRPEDHKRVNKAYYGLKRRKLTKVNK